MLSLFRRPTRLAAVLVGVGVLLVATPAVALETSTAEIVIIPEGDTFTDDLYTATIRVVVDGTLDGDLVAFAANEVVINGTVMGSITAVAPTVVVNGEVEGTIRAAVERIDVNGTVGGDVVTAAGTATFGEDSDVAGEVMVWAWNARALGAVGQDFAGTQRRLDLAGSVDGDVDVSVNQLDVVGDLVVGGDLGYRSDNDAEGVDRASVKGAIVAMEPLPPNIRVRALTVLGRFMIVLFLSIAALTSAYGWPIRIASAVTLVGIKPVRRWLVGA
ncbi:MAG TPA: polymer-forming cytoskeletal protein, partial [Acidimicrobiia bacterium]|nr:polymer-forming cytoskeletal protein [Acidimicrobiia bacterium]